MSVRSPNPRAVVRVLTALLASLVSLSVAAQPPEMEASLPELIVTAPPELSTAAEQIRRLDPRTLRRLVDFVGLAAAGPPIQVRLEPRGSETDLSTPSWVAGYAYGSLGTVVLFPDRTPSYPYGSFEEVVLHEIAHVLAARAAGFQAVPRWFNEGLAIVGAGTWSLDDQSWLTLAAVLDPQPTLTELETMFRGSRRQTARAYALSGAFVRDLHRRKGPEAIADVLARQALGLSFDEAFRRTIGTDPDTAAAVSWRRYSFWHRWVPIVTSSLTLWVGITLLALWAGVRKKRRRTALEEKWEAEEEAATAQAEQEAPGGWIH